MFPPTSHFLEISTCSAWWLRGTSIIINNLVDDDDLMTQFKTDIGTYVTNGDHILQFACELQQLNWKQIIKF